MTMTPTKVQPNQGAWVLTDYPELQAYVPYNGSLSENVVVTWQIASNGSFTTNLQSITTPIRYQSGQVAKAQVTTPLSQGVWYIRAKSTDINGVESALWSPVLSWHVDHKPFASMLRPAQGDRISTGSGVIRFSWQFSDADISDRQVAFHVRAFNAANDAVLFDSTKITSPNNYYDATVPVATNGFFYWQVKVYDKYNIESPWSDPTLFQLGNQPVATITYPTSSGTVDVPNPVVSWAFATGNDPPITYTDVIASAATYSELAGENATYAELMGGNPAQATQTHFRVQVKRNGETLHDSGWLAGSASTYQLPSIIHQGEPYDLFISVRDPGGFEGTSEALRFSGLWPAPDTPVSVIVDTSAVDDPFVGAVQITWNAELYDANFVEWRAYRRLVGSQAWQLIGTTADQSGRAEILDYYFESGRTYEYSVAQVARRFFNEEAESLLDTITATPISTKYMLIHGTEPSFNVMLSSVVSDSFTEEYEEFVAEVKGRGRRKEVGTRYGFTGSLTVHLRDLDERGSSLELAQLLAFRAGRVDAWLRIPFGYLWKVSIGNIGVDRMPGVGVREFADVTIPFMEIIE